MMRLSRELEDLGFIKAFSFFALPSLLTLASSKSMLLGSLRIHFSTSVKTKPGLLTSASLMKYALMSSMVRTNQTRVTKTTSMGLWSNSIWFATLSNLLHS